jgi:uncharacterized protein
MRLIDRLANELQLIDSVPRPAHATVGELLVGQRPVRIAEELQRPGGVGGEIGHATRSSRLTSSRCRFVEGVCCCVAAMRLLAFSDVHRDLAQAGRLVDHARDVDVVVAAGDFASVHRGLDELIDVLAAIETSTVLVAGNNETDAALRAACDGWGAARVLHGEGTKIAGVAFFGLGGGVPVTPWDWSFDLTEDEAAAALRRCPRGGVLVVHSPPKGYVDGPRGLGSEAILEAVEDKQPQLVVCGHIHEAAGEEAAIGASRVLNAGPSGVVVDL